MLGDLSGIVISIYWIWYFRKKALKLVENGEVKRAKVYFYVYLIGIFIHCVLIIYYTVLIILAMRKSVVNAVMYKTNNVVLTDTGKSIAIRDVKNDALVAPKTCLGKNFDKNVAVFVAQSLYHIEKKIEKKQNLAKLFENNPNIQIIRSIQLAKKSFAIGVIFMDNVNKIMYIVFRGSRTLKEWKSGCSLQTESMSFVRNIGNGKFDVCHNRKVSVHKYFLRLSQESCSDVFQSVVEHVKDFKEIVFGGYSLGGCIAGLVALQLLVEFPMLKDICSVYTFGKPRVGNTGYAELINKTIPRYWRIENENDMITSFPFSAMVNLKSPYSMIWYQHEGKPVRFVDHLGSIKMNHSLQTYINNLNKLPTSF